MQRLSHQNHVVKCAAPCAAKTVEGVNRLSPLRYGVRSRSLPDLYVSSTICRNNIDKNNIPYFWQDVTLATYSCARYLKNNKYGIVDSCTVCARTSHHCTRFYSRLEHLALYDLAHFSCADDTFHAVRFEIVGIFKYAHRYLALYTFSHSLRSFISPSLSMQLDIGAPYGAWSCASFISWLHLPCCSFWGSTNIQVRTWISWTAHLRSLFALYHLTIEFNAVRDWSTLRCMILRIFHLMMATSMLFVLRS